MVINVRTLYSDKMVKTSGLLFIASMVSNLSNYVFQFVMGRLLTPVEYGLMNALLSLLAILSVPVAPLFTVVSRKTSEYKSQGDVASIRSLYKVFSARIVLFGMIGLILYFVCAPFIRDYVHAPSLVPVLILGFAIVTTLAYPLNMAVLQGVQNFKWVGINQVLGGPAKLIFTLLFVLAGFSVNGVMLGMVATGFILWYLSYIPIRQYTMAPAEPAVTTKHISLSEVVPVFLALFAFAVLTQADMVLISRYFSAYDAGMYASAAILGKSVMYIPGAIVLTMFPIVSEQFAQKRSSRHLLAKSLAITVALSGFGALIFYLFPGWILRILYGAQYVEADVVLKYYGIAMLPMALLLVLMNYLIARKKRVFSYLMIAGAFAEILAVSLYHGSLIQVVVILLVIGTVLCGASIAAQYFPNIELSA